MLNCKYIVGVLACLMISSSIGAQTPVRDHEITLEDYFTLSNIAQMAISPDARKRPRWRAPAWQR